MSNAKARQQLHRSKKAAPPAAPPVAPPDAPPPITVQLTVTLEGLQAVESILALHPLPWAVTDRAELIDAQGRLVLSAIARTPIDTLCLRLVAGSVFAAHRTYAGLLNKAGGT